MTNENLLEIQKYEIDKKYELQQQKLDSASSIRVGNETLASISMLAEKFSKAGDMIPKEFQNQPEKCFAAIYKGAALGLDAFTSLQRIAVVNGRATIWGDAALGLVKNTGQLEHFKEYYGIWISKINLTKEELENPENQEMIKKFNGIVRKTAALDFTNQKFGAGCELKRKGGELVFQFFTVENATTAGLWGSNVWKKYPQRMIIYRPRAYALRDAFPDVLEGLYLKEEMESELKDVTPPFNPSKAANAHTALIAKPDLSFEEKAELPIPPIESEEPFIDQALEAENESQIKKNADLIYNKHKAAIKSLKNLNGLNKYFDYLEIKADLEYLKANAPELETDLQFIKNIQLEQIKGE